MTITIANSEVSTFTKGKPFASLDYNDKRRAMIQALRARNDNNSNYQAFAIEANLPIANPSNWVITNN